MFINNSDILRDMKKLLSGNEAVARGAYEAGVKLAASYPGTPATEIIQNISKYKSIYSEWSVNEKVALEVAFGSSYAGSRAIAAMKHVGLNIASDPLMTISYTGVCAGLVIVVVDDPGMCSSQNEQDSRNYAKFAKIPMLEPSDSQECKDFTKLAFKISEDYDTPIILRLTTRIAHSKSIVKLGVREESDKEICRDWQKYVMIPVNARRRRKVIEKRLRNLEELSNKINKIEGKGEIGVITSGVCYQYVKEVSDCSVLKLNMVYPLPLDLIKDFSRKVKKIFVVEELDPFIQEQIKAAGINVIGKSPRTGELNQELVEDILNGKKILGNGKVSGKAEFCNGCPHVPIFEILKKLKLVVVGDIGCYTLAALPPLNAMDIQINMGLSIGAMHGISKVRKKMGKKAIAVIGDSTFIHSGITSLINTIYNKGISKIIILDNRTTAMTGHQPHPGTGKTIDNELTHKLDFKKLIQAIGVKNIREVNPYNKKETEDVIKEELNKDGVSVIITNQPCCLIK